MQRVYIGMKRDELSFEPKSEPKYNYQQVNTQLLM